MCVSYDNMKFNKINTLVFKHNGYTILYQNNRRQFYYQELSQSRGYEMSHKNSAGKY